MKNCRTCKEAISYGLDDIDGEEVKMPKQVSTESIKAGQCKECYEVNK